MLHSFDIFKPYEKEISAGVVKDYETIEGGITANQIHTDVILEIDGALNETPDCDAFICSKKDLTLVVKVADCQGVLMYDPQKKVVAAVHSGWKGSTMNIIGKTVGTLRDKHGVNPENLLVAISPSLGPCCAEFSDPKSELPAFCEPYIKENRHVDFWNLSLDQLKEAGVKENHVEIAKTCTKCNEGYYSYRNGDGGRMGIFVKLI